MPKIHFPLEDAKYFLTAYEQFRSSREIVLARKYWRHKATKTNVFSRRVTDRNGDGRDFQIVFSDVPPKSGDEEFPCCFYQPQKQKDDAERWHKALAELFRKGTRFQKWLSERDAVKDALTAISKRQFTYFHYVKDHPILDWYALEEELGWRFDYIVTRALLVYNDPENHSKILVQNSIEHGLDENESFRVPDKIQNLAKRLRLSLEEIGYSAKMMDRSLRRLESGELTPHPSIFKPQINVQLKRRFFIRELCLAGAEELLPTRSKKGRFFPDAVVELCRLVDYTADKRSIESIQEAYDREKVIAATPEDRRKYFRSIRLYYPRNDRLDTLKVVVLSGGSISLDSHT